MPPRFGLSAGGGPPELPKSACRGTTGRGHIVLAIDALAIGSTGLLAVGVMVLC